MEVALELRLLPGQVLPDSVSSGGFKVVYTIVCAQHNFTCLSVIICICMFPRNQHAFVLLVHYARTWTGWMPVVGLEQ